MPTFTLTLHFRTASGPLGQEKASQKSYWESVAKELQERGARILNVQSRLGDVGEPPATVNVVTITYEAPAEIKYEGEQSL